MVLGFWVFSRVVQDRTKSLGRLNTQDCDGPGFILAHREGGDGMVNDEMMNQFARLRGNWMEWVRGNLRGS